MKPKRTFNELMYIVINKTIEYISLIHDIGCFSIMITSEEYRNEQIKKRESVINRIYKSRQIAINYIKLGFYIKETK